MDSSGGRRKQWRLSFRVVICVLIVGGVFVGRQLAGRNSLTGLSGDCELSPLLQGVPHPFAWTYPCKRQTEFEKATRESLGDNGQISAESENDSQVKAGVKEGLEKRASLTAATASSHSGAETHLGQGEDPAPDGGDAEGPKATPRNVSISAEALDEGRDPQLAAAGEGGLDSGVKLTPEGKNLTPESREVSAEDDVLEKGVSGLGFDGRTGGERRSDDEFSCDRSSWMTDTCRLRGIVRLQTDSTDVEVFTRKRSPLGEPMGVRPQPRKYDADMMAVRITEFRMVSKSVQELDQRGLTCDHVSDVPGVIFSAGGWIGNAFHEFTDVIIPLFITTERYHRKVRLLVSDAPKAWVRKYGLFLEIFSGFPVVLLGQNEAATWCFEELTLGLEIHGYLTVDPEKMPGGVGLARMSELYAQRLGMGVSANLGESTPKDDVSTTRGIPSEEERRKLRLGIVVRKGSGRVIENHERVVRLAEEEGFEVEELAFTYESPSLEDVFRTIQGLDVLMGVHGAALTYFVFMRPGTALIQVVPWGVRHVADVYDGAPARAHGLRYLAYEVEAAESSLIDQYELDDPVMADTDSVWEAGWAEGDRLYLRQQNVRLREERIRGVFRETQRELLDGIGEVTGDR